MPVAISCQLRRGLACRLSTAPAGRYYWHLPKDSDSNRGLGCGIAPRGTVTPHRATQRLAWRRTRTSHHDRCGATSREPSRHRAHAAPPQLTSWGTPRMHRARDLPSDHRATAHCMRRRPPKQWRHSVGVGRLPLRGHQPRLRLPRQPQQLRGQVPGGCDLHAPRQLQGYQGLAPPCLPGDRWGNTGALPTYHDVSTHYASTYHGATKQVWEDLNQHIRFVDVTEECRRLYGRVQSNCSLLELFVTGQVHHT